MQMHDFYPGAVRKIREAKSVKRANAARYTAAAAAEQLKDQMGLGKGGGGRSCKKKQGRIEGIPRLEAQGVLKQSA